MVDLPLLHFPSLCNFLSSPSLFILKSVSVAIISNAGLSPANILYLALAIC
jgi:hypothetical protein